MRMSEESYHKMNLLAGKCFDTNAVIDNLAYNLDFHYFNEVGKVVHLNVAHVMPEWADMITDKMLELSARPIRTDIQGYDKEYEDLPSIFDQLNKVLNEVLNQTRDLIGSADVNGDDEVRIFAENFLDMVSVYVKQSEEWLNAVKTLSPQEFNIHIKQYTHFIAL